MRAIFSRISSFRSDSRGNFGMMFVFSSTALLLGAAMAIDVSRMYSYQSKMTQAIDAAVLATTQGLTQGDIPLDEAEEKVLAYVNANLDGRNLSSGKVKIDNIIVDPVAKTLQVDAHTMMPMTMAGLVGYEFQRVSATSKAAYSDTEIEVVMALDVTGSMYSRIGGWSSPRKIDSLKKSAKLAIETIFDTPDAVERVRIGLTPYSEAVNAAPVIDKIETTGSTTGCVYERTGPDRYTDAFSTGSAKVKGTRWGCPSSPIVPLTTNEPALNAAIDDLSTGGCTAGHIAIAWTYYMLSPNWNPAWTDESKAKDFGIAGTRKYAIIMTDGMFNFFRTASTSCSSNYSKARSKEYALGLCNAMKARDIKVYSIAFDAPSDAKELMQNCASDKTATTNYYFDATNEMELENAFHTIALDIQGLRLVN